MVFSFCYSIALLNTKQKFPEKAGNTADLFVWLFTIAGYPKKMNKETISKVIKSSTTYSKLGR